MSETNFREEGNEHFGKGDFTLAIVSFSKGIKIEPDNHILFSNRSVSFLNIQKFSEAIIDADQAIKLKPDWFKGYLRKLKVLLAIEDLPAAKIVAEEGLEKCHGHVKLQTELEKISQSQLREQKIYQEMLKNVEISPLMRDKHVVVNKPEEPPGIPVRVKDRFWTFDKTGKHNVAFTPNREKEFAFSTCQVPTVKKKPEDSFKCVQTLLSDIPFFDFEHEDAEDVLEYIQHKYHTNDFKNTTIDQLWEKQSREKLIMKYAKQRSRLVNRAQFSNHLGRYCVQTGSSQWIYVEDFTTSPKPFSNNVVLTTNVDVDEKAEDVLGVVHTTVIPNQMNYSHNRAFELLTKFAKDCVVIAVRGEMRGKSKCGHILGLAHIQEENLKNGDKMAKLVVGGFKKLRLKVKFRKPKDLILSMIERCEQLLGTFKEQSVKISSENRVKLSFAVFQGNHEHSPLMKEYIMRCQRFFKKLVQLSNESKSVKVEDGEYCYAFNDNEYGALDVSLNRFTCNVKLYTPWEILQANKKWQMCTDAGLHTRLSILEGKVDTGFKELKEEMKNLNEEMKNLNEEMKNLKEEMKNLKDMLLGNQLQGHKPADMEKLKQATSITVWNTKVKILRVTFKISMENDETKWYYIPIDLTAMKSEAMKLFDTLNTSFKDVDSNFQNDVLITRYTKVD